MYQPAEQQRAVAAQETGAGQKCDALGMLGGEPEVLSRRRGEQTASRGTRRRRSRRGVAGDPEEILSVDTSGP